MFCGFSALIGTDAAPDKTADNTSTAASTPEPKRTLRMLTDADGHIFTVTGQASGWIYGTIYSVKGNDVVLIQWVFNLKVSGHTSPKSFPLTGFSKEDQQFIQDWVVKHPENQPGSPPPTPPLAPTGVAMRYSNREVYMGEGPVMANPRMDGLVDTSSVLKGRTITAIAHDRAGEHTLALCSDGTLVAWGSNQDGQLGIGRHGLDKDHPSMQAYAISPVLVHRPGTFKDKKITAIATSGGRNYALCSDGSVYAWGAVGREFHKPDPHQSVDEPTLFDFGALKGRKVVAIRPEVYSALCSDGTFIRWGPVTEPAAAVGNTRGLLAGKTITALTSQAIFCSDGTLTVWQYAKTPVVQTAHDELYLVKMEGVLAGKTVVAIATQDDLNYLLALCSDGTLVAWGGFTGPASKNNRMVAADAQHLTPKEKNDAAPDAASTMILPENIQIGFMLLATPPHLVSGTGVLKGKTVTALSGSLIQCSDGTSAYWSGYGLPERADLGGALKGKTILAVEGDDYNQVLLFREPDASAPAAALQPAP